LSNNSTSQNLENDNSYNTPLKPIEVCNGSNHTVDLNSTQLVVQINDKDVKPTNTLDKVTNVVSFESEDENIIFLDENGDESSIANIVEQESSDGEKQKVAIINVVNKNNEQHNDEKEITATIQEHKNKDGNDHSNNVPIKDSESINLTFGKQGIFVENPSTTFVQRKLRSGQKTSVDLFVNLLDGDKA